MQQADRLIVKVLEEVGRPIPAREIISRAVTHFAEDGNGDLTANQIGSRIWVMVDEKRLVLNKDRLIALPEKQPAPTHS